MKIDCQKNIQFVAGTDVAYLGTLAIGAVAVLDYQSLKLVESQTAIYNTRVPYIPSLLLFREIQPMMLSIKKLQIQPDLFLVDGHGIAHPYHYGLACHLGLTTGKPTIGIAKSKLIGEVANTRKRAEFAFLKYRNEVVGAIVTSKHGAKPVYISIGHMISLSTSLKIVTQCILNSHIPEPVRQAHWIANAVKRKIKSFIDQKH